MSNWYQILSRFLEQHGDQVEGRSLEPLTPELREELRRFANGELPPEIQQALLQRLVHNVEAMEFLADELRNLPPLKAPKRPKRPKTPKRPKRPKALKSLQAPMPSKRAPKVKKLTARSSSPRR